MSLKQTLQEDLKESLKNHQESKTSALRLLLTSLANKQKEKDYQASQKGQTSELLSDDEVMDIILSEVKKRKESIEQYQKGNRIDLAQKEEEEIKALMPYLPTQLSQEEITAIVREVLEKSQIKDMKNMGLALREIMPQVKGKADGALVSKIVKDILSSQ